MVKAYPSQPAEGRKPGTRNQEPGTLKIFNMKEKTPSTPAIRLLKERGVSFIPRPYKYEERGGTKTASRELGIDEHFTVKTLVMEDEGKRPLIILMHGDREVSTKALARELGVKTVTPCDPKIAQKHTGYMVGGTSPFATRERLPVYMEESIKDLRYLLINGGRRGFLIEMSPSDLVDILNPRSVSVGI